MSVPKHRKQLVADYKAGKFDFSRIELCHIDLQNVNLIEANFSCSNLKNANFTAANLDKANFIGTYLECAILNNSSLYKANFLGAELREACIERSNLARANLSRTNLAGANLQASNLSGVDLGQASLQGSNLENSDLTNANLQQTNLRGANLRGVHLTGVNLNQASLEMAIYSEDTLFPDRFDPADVGMIKTNTDSRVAQTILEQYQAGQREFSRINLSKIQMRQTDISDADLTAADLSNANFSASNLSHSILRCAVFSNSNLIETNLNQADLRGSIFENSQLIHAKLIGVNMSRADLSSANLLGAQLGGANLEQASLIGVVLAEADISDANLFQANLSQANLENANLLGANLSGANLTNTDLTGATYNEDTQFPKDFDPDMRGMRKNDRSQPQRIEAQPTSYANTLDINVVHTHATHPIERRSELIPGSTMQNSLQGRLDTGCIQEPNNLKLIPSPKESLVTSPNANTQKFPLVLNQEVTLHALSVRDLSDEESSEVNDVEIVKRLLSSKLSRLLAKEAWEDASIETMKLLLISRDSQQEKLNVEAVKKIPPEMIRAIDTLWSEFSRGNYGFKAQTTLLNKLKRHKSLDSAEELVRHFINRVQWHLTYYRSNYSVKVDRSQTKAIGQFPFYLSYFLTKDRIGVSYEINHKVLNCFWGHLSDCLSEIE